MNERYYITIAAALDLEDMENWADMVEAKEAEVEAERARIEAEMAAEYEWEMDALECLRRLWNEATPEAWDTYSDLYKDVHGVRPHGSWAHFFEGK